MKLAIFILCTLSVTFASPMDWRIVGGHNAYQNQFPHQISMRIFGSHSCGGSILDSTTILTAAHCVRGQSPSAATVVVGALKLSCGGRVHKVKSFVQHRNYNPNQLYNDIAIIKLMTPIQFDNSVQPIALPTSNVGAGQIATLSGWGKISYPGYLPNILQWINLRTITLEECRARHTIIIVDSEICTFTKRGEGACHGDSGGALIRNNQIIGIDSWSRPCAVGYPDVFTNVYSFLPWIAQNRH